MWKQPIVLSEEEDALMKEFINSLGNNLKERTKSEYMKAFKKMRDDFGGIRPLTQEDVNNWLIKRKGSLNRAVMKNWIEFIGFAVKIPKNRGTTPRKEIVTIPKEEQAKIIAYAYEHSDNVGYPIAISLALLCALRRGEVVSIKKDDFQWSKWRQDLLEDSNAPCELIVRGKGSKERVVVVPKSLMLTIFDYINYIEGSNLFTFKDSQFYQKFNEVCKGLGLVNEKGKAKYHPHTMRHTQGTQWYEEGVDIMEIRDRLGHVSVATTQLYINPSKETAIRKWKDSLK